MKAIPLNKEYIDKIKFNSQDVLNDAEKRRERKSFLYRALKLGNMYKSKVKLIVKDMFTRHIEVEAIVLSVTEKYVILKGNKMVPINSIVKVNLV